MKINLKNIFYFILKLNFINFIQLIVLQHKIHTKIFILIFSKPQAGYWLWQLVHKNSYKQSNLLYTNLHFHFLYRHLRLVYTHKILNSK
jgi:hypothetical protein